MAGWSDYGIGPGGDCQGTPPWTVVDGLYAAFNERVELFADDPSDQYAFFTPLDLDSIAPSSPGRALDRLFTEIFYVFCSKRNARRVFLDGTQFRLDDPSGLDPDSDGFAVVTEDRETQSASNRTWLASFLGVPEAASSGGGMFLPAFWFKEWQACVEKLYWLINGWRYHYEYCSYERGEWLGELSSTRELAYESAKLATPVPVSGGSGFHKRNDAGRGSYRTFVVQGSIFNNNQDSMARIYGFDGVDFALTPNDADQTIQDISGCAVSAMLYMNSNINWSGFDTEYPPGTTKAIAFPQTEKINLSPVFYNPDDYGLSGTTSFYVALEDYPLCVYDLSSKLDFWRCESPSSS